MKNKGIVVVLAIVITSLCIYYLSFTYVAIQVKDKADIYGTDSKGVINLNKKQFYLDSVWNLPVYNFLGTEYTYKEVKDHELSLGLDLQGGMHVTLEVSPVDIIKGLSNNSEDPSFLKALSSASALQKTSQQSFSSLFFEAYEENNPGQRLAYIFSNSVTRGRIASNDSDDKVIGIVNAEIESAIDRSFTILRNRIDQFGTSQPNIQRLPGTGRIQIEIPGADNPQRVRKLLQGVARLEFYDVVEPAALNSSLMAINELLVKEQNSSSIKRSPEDESNESDLSDLLGDSTQVKKDSTSNGAQGLDSLQNLNISPLFSLSIPPGTFRYSVQDTSKIKSIFMRSEIRAMLPKTIGLYWAYKADEDRNGQQALELYFLDIGRNGKARLTGEVVSDARSDLDERGEYAVSMKMNSIGTRIWAKWTAEASSKTPKGRIAIVLDNSVYSAPFVNGEIPNGNSEISGSFTLEESKDLANVLKAGSLPAPTRIVEEAIIGPTLGKVAQSEGFISMVTGMAVVVVFMIAYYGKGGAVANLALLFNIFFIVGILAQLDAALTLPGIAGIVLTMGMAVDANVIIYERIREELRQGKRLREAISFGYKRSFWTIFDSNVTTLLTALILYLFGQGPVKGFAVTLMVGIVTTFFTAVYISRVVIEAIVAKKGDDSNVRFQTIFSKFSVSNLNVDFVGMRKVGYLFSSVVIAVGITLILFQGLNLGVDFKGGRSFVVGFSEPVVATDMKVSLGKSFEGVGTEVKNYGGNNVVKVTTSYLIDDESEVTDEKVKSKLIEGIEQFTGLKYVENNNGIDKDHFTVLSSSKVGATIADDIKAASLEAALLSLVAIFLYILIRFRKWQFSTGAIVSLAHDTAFVFAAFAIARAFGVSFEIEQVFVAAVLTVIGYSINDTVIIFDRIREYLGLGTSHDMKKIFNSAINSTLNRTIITSGTTLLVVIALLFLGGEVLRGFSFALFVGIGIGTYSSVFIAAPIVLDLKTNNKMPDSIDLNKRKTKLQEPIKS
jgi:SecD/SecF fusion protein